MKRVIDLNAPQPTEAQQRLSDLLQPLVNQRVVVEDHTQMLTLRYPGILQEGQKFRFKVKTSAGTWWFSRPNQHHEIDRSKPIPVIRIYTHKQNSPSA